MKIGILKAGSPPDSLSNYGSYPAMVRKLLGEEAFAFAEFDVEAGELPHPDALSAYIITGSAASTYDDAAWIARLKTFLGDVKQRAALLGICFGHQVMAEAFGGKVMRSPHGWSGGARTYGVVRPEPWLNGARAMTLPAAHEDHVVKAPPEADVVACNACAPFGMLAYRTHKAMSLQLHPEFEPEFAAALVESRRGKGLDDEEADRAIQSLRGPTDRDRAAEWIRSFLLSGGG